ncbi:phospholipid carrier-dependent glycosyltransferase [bacterium]|nr:MAG: phospholipid carrier-dependent glycosyltransferase [bacterium]
MQKIKTFVGKHTNIVAGLLLTLMCVLAIGSMRGENAIVDEIAHIPAGYSYMKYGDFRLNPEHPPLLKDLAAVPLLFIKDLKFPTELFAWKDDVNGQWESGWHFIYHIGNDANQIVFWSRIPMVLIMLLLGFFLFKASKEWFGDKAALIALSLYALSPNIIAHGRFVTTDVGVAAFMFISIYYFIKWLKSPGWVNVCKASVALALAQLAKFSSALIIPLFLIATIIYTVSLWLESNRSIKSWMRIKLQYGGKLMLIFITAFIMIGIFYWPHVKNMPVEKIHAQIEVGVHSEKAVVVRNVLDKMADIPLLRPHAYYLTGFAMVVGRVAGGNTTFFLGEVTNQSFRSYFPVVYLAKTPLATLILVLTAFAMAVFYTLKSLSLSPKKLLYDLTKYCVDHITEITLLLFIAIYSYTSITGNLNIGFRHLIPIMPMIFILTGYEIAKLLKPECKFMKHLLILLLVWLAGATVLTYPHYVAYFNEAAGGSKNGYKIVTDSNVDWGQDLRNLVSWVKENNIENIKVDYFGGGCTKYYFCDRIANPEDIGPASISESEAYDCSNSPFEEWHANNGQSTGWFAISATFLQNSAWNKLQYGEEDYGWLREMEPTDTIGGSILIYYVE